MTVAGRKVRADRASDLFVGKTGVVGSGPELLDPARTGRSKKKHAQWSNPDEVRRATHPAPVAGARGMSGRAPRASGSFRCQLCTRALSFPATSREPAVGNMWGCRRA